MRISTKQAAIVFMLLATSCGSEAASNSGSVTPASDVTIRAESAPITALSSDTETDAVPPEQAAFPARIAVTSKDGKVTTFSRGDDPIVTIGVMNPTGEVVVSADAVNGRTMIEWHRVRTDVISATIQIDGELRPTAVAQDGKLVALVGVAGPTTTVVLATPSKGEIRRWTFDAVLVPEAFSNVFEEGADTPIGVFVIEYLDTNTYRVRVIDTATGTLGLPLNLRDKSQAVDEVMTAVSRTAVFEPNNQLLFTLYQDAREDGEDVGSFIHTLGLFNGVWCLDVPPQLGLADHPGALAVSPDGTRLFAASSTGGVAGYMIKDITSGGQDMPEALGTTRLDASVQAVAVGASNDELVVALGGSIFRLDPSTLAVRNSFTWDMFVQALTVLDDSSIVIVGSGRMTLVSPDGQLMAERTMPNGDADIIRVAVVD